MQQAFLGTWKLKSFHVRLPLGMKYYPFGEDVTGILFYTPEGRMAAQLSGGKRPAFQKGYKVKNGLPNRMAAAMRATGYLAYYGTWQVREAEGVIDHFVDDAMVPAMIGETQVRKYVFTPDGQGLTLSVDRFFLEWERLA